MSQEGVKVNVNHSSKIHTTHTHTHARTHTHTRTHTHARTHCTQEKFTYAGILAF